MQTQMINLTKIPKNEQEGMLSSFWMMLGDLENHADNSKNLLDMHTVSEMYKQWNRITGDNKEPVWISRTKP